jgi:hypothetical protein
MFMKHNFLRKENKREVESGGVNGDHMREKTL